MYISDDDDPKYSGEVEKFQTLDITKDTRTYKDLYNQSTHKSEGVQYSGESEDKYQDLEKNSIRI